MAHLGIIIPIKFISHSADTIHLDTPPLVPYLWAECFLRVRSVLDIRYGLQAENGYEMLILFGVSLIKADKWRFFISMMILFCYHFSKSGS